MVDRIHPCTMHEGETLMARIKTPDGGGTVPGEIILVGRMEVLHPFVTWFFNSQYGGRHCGNYFETYEEAARDFADRIRSTFPQPKSTGATNG